MELLFRDAEVHEERVHVRVSGGRITHVSDQPISVAGVDEVIEGEGGALLPGLHDHHLHLLAMAAALESVDCGPAAVTGRADLAQALASAPGSDWIRGVGYHESVAGDLDRHRLDEWVPDRPVRVQHRGGALWVLNSAALSRVTSVLSHSKDVERDADGRPNGRLWRYDAHLQTVLPRRVPDLAPVGRLLARHGITRVTDASPDPGPEGAAILTAAVRDGTLPVHLTLLGAGDLPQEEGVRLGPRKIMLRDHDLPSLEKLVALITHIHRAGRSVAVHCVTANSLVLTLVALQQATPRPGDRIEHAAVVPRGACSLIRELGVVVVTQPGFLYARGDDYLTQVPADELPDLYPYARFLDTGVPVFPSSDAPYGPLDPWQVMRTARERESRSGMKIGAHEEVSVETVLTGYLSEPWGQTRRVHPGADADLCLLSVPLGDALASPSSDHVRLSTGRGGRAYVVAT